MDHETTREQLDLAAAEPGGLDRLGAGDTAAAQAVAAHLAGCPECADELARLGRSARLIRDTVVTLPPADLRDRTLAAIRVAGVARPRAAPLAAGTSSMTIAVDTVAAEHMATDPGAANPMPAAPVSLARAGRSGRTDRVPGRTGRVAIGWVAVLAAAVVASVVATTAYVDSRVDNRLASQSETIEALEEVTAATLAVTAETDVRRVSLDAGDPELSGTLVFSPSTSELVVVARGLTPPPDGQEYRCWVERANDRQRVGLMFFSDDLAYWVGPVPAVEGLSDDARFGVSLVTVDGSADTVDVLAGDL